jgi:hypothetical protein
MLGHSARDLAAAQAALARQSDRAGKSVGCVAKGSIKTLKFALGFLYLGNGGQNGAEIYKNNAYSDYIRSINHGVIISSNSS